MLSPADDQLVLVNRHRRRDPVRPAGGGLSARLVAAPYKGNGSQAITRTGAETADSPMVLDQAAPLLRFGGHHGELGSERDRRPQHQDH